MTFETFQNIHLPDIIESAFAPACPRCGFGGSITLSKFCVNNRDNHSSFCDSASRSDALSLEHTTIGLPKIWKTVV